MTDAWAETVGPGFQEVPVEHGEVTSTSAPNMCPKSPNEGRHEWVLDAVCSQSIERKACKHCGQRIYD